MRIKYGVPIYLDLVASYQITLTLCEEMYFLDKDMSCNQIPLFCDSFYDYFFHVKAFKDLLFVLN